MTTIRLSKYSTVSKYQIVQHHRHTAEAVGGKYGVYVGEDRAQPISVHETIDSANAAITRYEQADARRGA